MLGIAASKFFVMVCASASWTYMGPAIKMARAAQLAAMMVRIFIGFLALGFGRFRSRHHLGPEGFHIVLRIVAIPDFVLTSRTVGKDMGWRQQRGDRSRFDFDNVINRIFLAIRHAN